MQKTLKFSVKSQILDLFMVFKYISVLGINIAKLYHHFEDTPHANSVAKDITSENMHHQ